MDHVVQSARLPNGVRLPYVERGPASGTPLIMLHGFTDSWRSFEGVLERLPTWIRAIALTLRGHADADAPDTGYHPADFADDLRRFMDVLGIRQSVIAGHSFGSSIAQRFAIDHPKRTTALILMGSYTTLTDCREVREMWETSVSGMADPVDPALARAFQESTLARAIAPAFLEMAIGDSLKVPARVWQAVMREGMIDTDFSDDLRLIEAPTLILWGERDSFMSKEKQLALLALIAKARLLVHEEAGHALHWEDPARTVSDIASFIAATMAVGTRIAPRRPVARRSRSKPAEPAD